MVARESMPSTRRLPAADLHVHASMRPEEAEAVAAELERLGRDGLQRLWVYAHIVPLPPDEYARRMARLPVPALRSYSLAGVDDSVDGARKFLASVNGGPAFDVIPMVDRLGAEVLDRMDDVLAAAGEVAAVKLVHDLDLVDEDPDRLEWDHAALLGRLADAGVPAIVHVDLRRSEAWVRRTLTELPTLRLTVAHLGYSRSRMGPILDEFDNVVTDIANLASHMEGRPESYREFFDRYAGRVVFGSDAFLGDLSAIERHARAVQSLGLSPAALDQILQPAP